MYRPERQRAIKEKYLSQFAPAGTKADHAKKTKRPDGPTIARKELENMHHILREVREINDCQPGTEAFNLLCLIGCCLGNWPKISPEKVKEMRRRFCNLMGGLKRGDDASQIMAHE